MSGGECAAAGTQGRDPLLRRLARERVREQLASDILHGATLERSEREIGEGDLSIQCVLKGTRVRRFKDFDPLPDAAPVVRLT